MDRNDFVDVVGYITVLFGTIGLFAELSLYPHLLDLVNTWKEGAAAGSSLGVNLMLAFVTILPPLVILFGLSLLVKGTGSSEYKTPERTDEGGNGGL